MVVGQMRQRLAFAHQGAFAEQGLDQIHRHHGGAVVHVKGGVEFHMPLFKLIQAALTPCHAASVGVKAIGTFKCIMPASLK